MGESQKSPGKIPLLHMASKDLKKKHQKKGQKIAQKGLLPQVENIFILPKTHSKTIKMHKNDVWVAPGTLFPPKELLGGPKKVQKRAKKGLFPKPTKPFFFCVEESLKKVL